MRRLHGRLRAWSGVRSLRGALWGTPELRSAALVVLLAALVAACGGGSGGEGDPATLVPSDAQFYAELVVPPEGSQREDALDAAGKVLLTDDPEAEIREFLQRTHEDFDYDRDFE